MKLMRLQSIASSFPKPVYSQSDCLNALQASHFWQTLNPRSLRILEKVLTGQNGIESRHFAVDTLEEAWKRDAQQLNEAFEREAPRLGHSAVIKALERASLQPDAIDVLLVSTCTGYLCPGLSTHIAEKLGLRADCILQDLTGHGCGAALPLVQIAAGYAKLYPSARIVTAQVEVCSAAFHLDDDLGVLISACLFGDGASAQVWSAQEGTYQIDDFRSLQRPEHREALRFINHQGRYKNRLQKTIPAIAAETVGQLAAASKIDTNRIPILHGGGRDVLDALMPVFSNDALEASRDTLRRFGNLSSPSLFVALEAAVANSSPKEAFWLCGFGAGFSAHCAQLSPSD